MKQLLYAFLILTLASCGLDTKSHYFDLEEFTETKVYQFECEEDSSLNLYLEMTSNLDNNQLTTTNYNSRLLKTADFVEEFTNEGAILISFELYTDDQNNPESFEVVENEMFQWEVTDQSFSYLVKSEGGMQLRNTRNYFTRAHMDVLGEKYEVLGFKDIISYSTSSISFEEHKYYGEGVGLVGIELIEGDITYHLRLTSIMSADEWSDYKSEFTSQL